MRLLRTLLLIILLGFGAQATIAADADKFFDQSLGDFPAELKAATAAGKAGVMLMFEAEACPYCRRMRQQVLSRGDVQAYFRKHFSAFSVDVLGDVPITDFAGRETTEKAYARAARVRGTPTFVFVTAEGSEVARASGAMDAAEFLRLGRYVAEGHYKTMSLEQFGAANPERKK